MIKPLPQKKQKFGKKIGKILTFVFGAITLISLAGVIAFAMTKPSDQRIEAASGTIKSIDYLEDRWVYSTTTGDINLCNKENEVLNTTNVIDYLVDETALNRDAFKMYSLEYCEGSNNLYVIVTVTNSGKTTDYVVRYELNERRVELINTNDYLDLGQRFSRITDDGTYTYIITTSGSYRQIRRYHTDNLKLGSIKDDEDNEHGYLFSLPYYDTYSREVEVEIASDPIILSLDVYNNHLYLVYDAGLCVIPADNYKYNNEQQCKWIEEGKSVRKVDGSDGLGGWDFAQYNCYILDGDEFHGAQLINGTFVIATASTNLYHTSVNKLPKVPKYLPLTTYPDITFPAALSTKGNAISYNHFTKQAVIIYDEVATTTLVDINDINKPYMVFSDNANINISRVIQTIDGRTMIYLYTNSEEAVGDVNLLSTKAIDKVEYKFLAEKLIVVSVILFIIFAICLLIALLIWVKKMFLEKFLNFLHSLRKDWVTYSIMGACLVLLFMFCYYPAVGSISMSFFHYKTGEPVTFNFFRNYIQIFSDGAVWQSFGNMAVFLIADIVTALIPPLIFAFFLTVMRGKKFSTLTRTLLFLPAVIPGVTKMMIWQTGIYGDNGIINNIIKAFNGEPVVFFQGGAIDIWMLILMGFPYVGSYLVFYGALMNVPSSYYEAAELEGMGVWRRFVRIDIPLIRPQIKYVFVLTFIASVQNFGRTYMITSSQFTLRTPIHLMYEAIQKGDYGYSSAMATILFVLLFIATLFNMRKQKEKLGDAI